MLGVLRHPSKLGKINEWRRVTHVEYLYLGQLEASYLQLWQQSNMFANQMRDLHFADILEDDALVRRPRSPDPDDDVQPSTLRQRKRRKNLLHLRTFLAKQQSVVKDFVIASFGLEYVLSLVQFSSNSAKGV